MADLYLHSKLAEQVIKELPHPLNQQIVFIGAQGPDPLYYNVSKKIRQDSKYCADRVHDTNTRLFFKNMVTYVKSHLNEETYSFLVGFITHYALDVSIHPYVYYNVGEYKKEDPSTHQYRGLHMKFERSIDASMIQKDFGFPSRKFRLSRKHVPRIELSPDISKIMGHSIKNTYGRDNGGTFYELGVKKMHKNIRYLISDRFGIKKQIMKLVDLFSNSDMFLSDLSYFNHVEDFDFINAQKSTWHHPITNEPSNESVEELLEKARVFALKLIRQVDAYLYDNKDVELKKVFTNLSFNSGMDCDLHDEMKYFNNYRK